MIGLTLSFLGFILIIINAINYIARLNKVPDTLFMFGLILVAIGMVVLDKNKKIKK